MIGQSLQVDGREREIVGVMEPGFRLLDHASAVYLPFQFDRAEVMMGNDWTRSSRCVVTECCD